MDDTDLTDLRGFFILNHTSTSLAQARNIDFIVSEDCVETLRFG
ncbi:MAG: hypothetical protein ACOVMG_05625 [Flavobacterium sp.]